MRQPRCPGWPCQASSAVTNFAQVRFGLCGDVALGDDVTIRRTLPRPWLGYEKNPLVVDVTNKPADMSYRVEYTGSFSDLELCADWDIVMHAVRHT